MYIYISIHIVAVSALNDFNKIRRKYPIDIQSFCLSKCLNPHSPAFLFMDLIKMFGTNSKTKISKMVVILPWYDPLKKKNT